MKQHLAFLSMAVPTLCRLDSESHGESCPSGSSCDAGDTMMQVDLQNSKVLMKETTSTASICGDGDAYVWGGGAICSEALKWGGKFDSVDDCSAKCKSESKCTGYTYWGTGGCRLSSDCSGTTWEENAPLSVACSTIPYCPDGDTHKGRGARCIETLKWAGEMASVDDCSEKCKETAGCTGYTYYGTTVCMLSNDCSTAEREERSPLSVSCSIPMCADGDTHVGRGAKCSKTLKWAGKMASVDECSAKCKSESGCTGYTYYGTTVCMLSDDCSTATTEADAPLSVSCSI